MKNLVSKLPLYIGTSLLFLLLSGCFLDGLGGNEKDELDESMNECSTECEDDNDALYQGYNHWEHFTPSLSDAVAVSVIDQKLMKVTNAGEVVEAFTNDKGQSYGVRLIHRSHDDMIYLGAPTGCTEDGSYCQCTVIEINPATDATTCIFQPTKEYKWGFASALYKTLDNKVIIEIGLGDNSGEEILSIKDSVATPIYTSQEGILEIFPMDNGGVFVVTATDNMGNGKSIYIPKAGGTPKDISAGSISAVMQNLTGSNDTYYYVVDDQGYRRFDPLTETVVTPVYMGRTFYSATGYAEVYYDTDQAYYYGYTAEDTDRTNPVTLDVSLITPAEATVILSSDQHLALSSPQMPLFTMEIDDVNGISQEWTLTNWGLHSFDLPNVPTAVDLGLSGLTNVREVAPVNKQSAVLLGGSSSVPYYLKHYYADAGSGALSIDLLQGVVDGAITLHHVKYDPIQQHLLFYLTKTATDQQSNYLGVSRFTLTDTTSHSGGFGTVSLIPVDGDGYNNSEFVFMP